MKDNLFDNFLQDKLANHESPVPEGLWERIEADKRRPAAGWFNSKFLLLNSIWIFGALALAGYVFFTPPQRAFNTNKNQTTDKSEMIVGNDLVDANNNIPTYKSINNNSSSNNVDLSTIIIKSPSFIVAENTNVSTNNKEMFITKQKKNKAFATATTDNFSIIKKRRDAKNENFLAINQSQFNIENDEQESNTFYATDFKNISVEKFKAASLINVPQLNNNKMAGKFKLPAVKGLIDCPKGEGVENNWYLEVYASPDYNIKSVKSNGAWMDEYLSKKDSTETMKGGFTAGFRLARTLSNGLVLKGGIQYSQINEQFAQRSESERKLVTVITTRNITDANGNVTTVNDTSMVLQISYRVKKAANRYRNIEIPLTVGYEFGNDVWHASLNGGVIINASSWYSGEVLDTSPQTTSPNATKSSRGIYTHKVGLSLYGSMSIARSINDKISVFAEPYFRYGLTNMNAVNLGYSQRFSTIGLSLGVRYKLTNIKLH